jgi:uncharacterized protein (TIGR04255 family)
MRDPIPSGTLRQIAEIHGRFRQELPRKIEQQILTLPFPVQPFGRPVAPQLSTPDQLGGLIFDYLSPTGVPIRSLNIGQNRIVYMVTQYNRWGETWPLAERLLSECGKIVMESIPVVGVLLEYQSEYQWHGDGDQFDLVNFIRAENDLLSNNLFHRSTAMHSYSGWVERSDDAPAGIRVDNFNFSIAQSPGDPGEPAPARWRARIAVQHRLTFDEAIGDAAAFFTGDPVGTLTGCMDHMHELNKNLVRRALADEMIARIPGLAP